jgi:hypothetical protein
MRAMQTNFWIKRILAIDVPQRFLIVQVVILCVAFVVLLLKWFI